MSFARVKSPTIRSNNPILLVSDPDERVRWKLRTLGGRAAVGRSTSGAALGSRTTAKRWR